MTDYFTKLFEFNDWANTKIYDFLWVNKITEQRAWKIFSHIINVQELWLDRLSAVPNPISDTWKNHPAAKLLSLSKSSSEQWQDFIAETESDQWGNYCPHDRVNGEHFSNSYQDILTHVINHGTHHRAQIIDLIKIGELPLPELGYINFCRDRR